MAYLTVRVPSSNATTIQNVRHRSIGQLATIYRRYGIWILFGTMIPINHFDTCLLGFYPNQQSESLELFFNTNLKISLNYMYDTIQFRI